MLRTVSLAAVVVASTLTAMPPILAQEPTVAAEAAPIAEVNRSGLLPVNGLDYYYEIRGEGEPLLLLHGGLGTIDMFEPVLPMLAEGRQVIAVDLHGHGRTALGDREISYVDIADDLAVLLRELGYGEVAVFGYSFGGGVALRLAVQHPSLVRRLVLVSAGYARDGFYPEMLEMQAEVSASMAESMRETPMYQSYAAVAPNPEDFPRLLDRMGGLMRRPYDWSAEVERLTVPTMLVFGDADMFRLEHIVSFYKLLGGGQGDAGWMRENMAPNRLAILPDLTHYEIFMAPAMVSAVLPFLNGESEPVRWTGRVGEGQ
jgi:pimeloyl-ACP methyl ester carboxylesterase